MASFSVWDMVCLAVGAYIAVMALVRLMRAHRRKITDELYEQFRAEQARTQKQSQKKPREEAA